MSREPQDLLNRLIAVLSRSDADSSAIESLLAEIRATASPEVEAAEEFVRTWRQSKSSATAEAVLNGPPTNGTAPPDPVAATADEQPIPEVHSEEWERLNDRRGDLIFKKNREGLTDAEQVEFERLQKIVFAAIDKKYPRTPPPWEKLRALEARLKGSGG
jgi:hypothetical protein